MLWRWKYLPHSNFLLSHYFDVQVTHTHCQICARQKFSKTKLFFKTYLCLQYVLSKKICDIFCEEKICFDRECLLYEVVICEWFVNWPHTRLIFRSKEKQRGKIYENNKESSQFFFCWVTSSLLVEPSLLLSESQPGGK